MTIKSQPSAYSVGVPLARPSRCRTPFLIVALLAIMLLVLGARGAAAQVGCTGPAGETSVAVDLIRDAGNIPIIESSDTVRREYAHITSGLRDALGITVPADPDDDVRPQIRVIVETATLASGLRSTATFTVEAVIAGDPTLRIEVYDQDPGEGGSDDDSGVYKLFEAAGFDAAATLTVHAAAPSRSQVYDAGLTTGTRSFCEPQENDPPDPAELYGLLESATVESARDFVLLVPHGGMVEEGTSEQIAEIEAAFAIRGLVPSVWEAIATWDGDMASERFHTTSKAIDPQSFPGLEQLLAAGDWDAGSGVEFQHAASLHGFGSFTGDGIVFGGRAAQEIKCYVAHRIQQRFDAEGLSALAYYVYDGAGDPATALDLPDGGGVRITDQRPNVGLTGTSCDNIVNRLTQSAGCTGGLGGIQIEESYALRGDPQVRGLVSEEIAHAFADMIEDPGLVDPAATVYCDALDSAATGGPGQIGDEVWVDLDGDGVQDPAEPGREGVTVELLENGLVVATTTTSTTGRYLFGGLTPATYTVRVTVLAGFSFSPSGQGATTADSDVLPGGDTGAIVLAAGETRLDVDAGLVPAGVAATIGDFVWQDDNGDGVHDPGEPGLAGVTVELSTTLGTPVATTTSDAAGNYAFAGLLPGDYVLDFTASGWVATSGATIGPFSLAADAVDESRDAGFTAVCEDFALVAFGSEWTFLPTGGVAAAGWNQDGFADGAWDSGNGLLGFSTSKTVHTTVPNFSDTVTYYFRHELTVGDASLVQALELELERDDGAIVYLNGQEVLRSNLPAGPIDADTRAVDSSWERVTATVDPALLDDGPNLLAVEIHQRYKGSTADFAFDLELRAKSCDPCAVAALELTSVADTYLRQDQPNTDKGGTGGLWADGGPGEGRSPLLAWDLSAAPAGETVLGVEILFEVTNDTSAYFPLYGLTTAWDEAEATWNEALTGTAWDVPGATGVLDRAGATLGVAHAGDVGPYILSFTAAGRQLVGDWISGTAANHGLIVAAGDSTNGLEVDSREGTAPPILRVVHTTSCTP